MHATLRKLFTLILINVFISMAQSMTGYNEYTVKNEIIFEHWQGNEDHFQQFALPVNIHLPFSRQFLMDVTFSPAFNQYSGNGKQLMGPSDTQIRGAFAFAADQLMLTFGANVPSGYTTLSNEQLLVANIMAQKALDLRVPILGQGFDTAVGLVAAQQLSDVYMGLGIGYLRRGSFTPYQDQEIQFEPGNELSFSVGADINKHNFILSADASLIRYGEDSINGVVLFRAGHQFKISVSGQMNVSEFKAILIFQHRIRQKNWVGFGSLLPEVQNSNGRLTDVALVGSFDVNARLSLSTHIKTKFYGNNAYGIGGATIAGIGVGGKFKVSDSVRLESNLAVYSGSMNGVSSKIDLFGMELGGGIHYTL